ncbi:Ribonuclease H1 [Caenorhabditis elegans]|uniref:Ribonuclease H1 n=1 Tax=Caenorhabditis elegans TaxID=6239 RepID=Q86MG7_CAEEL|nr:Ribonuclease H1 [Caenorhabditis elegans]CCD70468.1 Ribonuclease H1 [Caenorhabditis elegans]|eukprot:NP_001040786.1 Ribonuclease H1 [Caenorhabditis elegans]
MGKNDQYYAVARGKQVGIYRTWNECKTQIDGFQNARFKKFATEAEARKFVADNMSVPGSKPVTPAVSTSSATRKRTHEGTKFTEAKKMKTEEEVIDPEFANAPVVYTDGACSSNGTKNAKAGWGVYWGDDSEDNEFGPVYGAPTNNRGELIAVQKAIEKAIEKRLPKVVIKTDSNLLVQSMNIWIHGWKRKGWKTSTGSEVLNQDVLMKIDNLRQKLKVKFLHVRGHAGIDGNEKADELARKGAQMFIKRS